MTCSLITVSYIHDKWHRLTKLNFEFVKERMNRNDLKNCENGVSH